jgi:hypothetical protein
MAMRFFGANKSFLNHRKQMNGYEHEQDRMNWKTAE